MISAIICFSCSDDPAVTRIPQKFFAIEFVNQDSSDYTEGILGTTRGKLIKYGYVNADSGLLSIDTNVAGLAYNFAIPGTQMHRFVKFDERASVNDTMEKMVVTFDSASGDSVLTISVHSYEKLGHPEWQSTKNPGSFTFSSTSSNSLDEIVWLEDLIVRLTFK